MRTLELRGVSKVYGEGTTEVHALRAVNLSVEAGEMVAVMAERFGQEHLADHRRQPGTADHR